MRQLLRSIFKRPFALSTKLLALSAKIACGDERIHPRNHQVQGEMRMPATIGNTLYTVCALNQAVCAVSQDFPLYTYMRAVSIGGIINQSPGATLF